jgi:hypothetical protein
MRDYVGRCDCGQIEIHLRSALAPAAFRPRSDASSCDFCRAHDGVWISDAQGEARLRPQDRTHAQRFASQQVAFHFCADCGALAYARFDAREGGSVVVLRLALFDEICKAAPPPMQTAFETETIAEARARRLKRWTPLVGACVA